ncbi:hypothetical protein [Paenibacillus sp. FSL R10-2736]|uniref:hypothetical protein n=1 Tax=Paenibacillus sp. FSL R10-2736 TaxID=2954692 RepID=UPI0030FA0CF3
MYNTKRAIFIDFKELKEFAGVSHEKRIVDAYLDKDKDRIVIEIEAGRRLRDASEELIIDRTTNQVLKHYTEGKPINQDRQRELRELHGRVVGKELERF